MVSFSHLEPNTGRVVWHLCFNEYAEWSGRTMQMNSFNTHGVVDHAWKHIMMVSGGNMLELQVHRRTGKQRWWKNDYFHTVFWRKDKTHPLSAVSCWDCWVVFSRSDLKCKVIYLFSCDWCHCAPKPSLLFLKKSLILKFSVQNRIIYVGECSFCAALRHLGWERPVRRVIHVLHQAHTFSRFPRLAAL